VNFSPSVFCGDDRAVPYFFFKTREEEPWMTRDVFGVMFYDSALFTTTTTTKKVLQKKYYKKKTSPLVFCRADALYAQPLVTTVVSPGTHWGHIRNTLGTHWELIRNTLTACAATRNMCEEHGAHASRCVLWSRFKSECGLRGLAARASLSSSPRPLHPLGSCSKRHVYMVHTH
jgi:hypothetical protein